MYILRLLHSGSLAWGYLQEEQQLLSFFFGACTYVWLIFMANYTSIFHRLLYTYVCSSKHRLCHRVSCLGLYLS